VLTRIYAARSDGELDLKGVANSSYKVRREKMAIIGTDPIKGYPAPYVEAMQQDTGGQIDLRSYQSVKATLNVS
jgi:hypothetical protein